MQRAYTLRTRQNSSVEVYRYYNYLVVSHAIAVYVVHPLLAHGLNFAVYSCMPSSPLRSLAIVSLLSSKCILYVCS